MKEYKIKDHTILLDDNVDFNANKFNVGKWRHMFYCYRTKDSQFLHHILIGKKRGFVVDHKDRNGLNNQLENLKHVTHRQNQQNSEIIKTHSGVYQCSKTSKWYARIKVGPKRINLGSFIDLEDAMKKYEEAQEFYKDFEGARGGM